MIRYLFLFLFQFLLTSLFCQSEFIRENFLKTEELKKSKSIFLERFKYPIKNYWDISGIKHNGENTEITDFESVNKTTHKLKVKKSGKYEFIFQSIFGDTISRFAIVEKNKPDPRITYPKLEDKVIKYSEIKNSIFQDANKIQVAIIYTGCFGGDQEYLTFSKNEASGVIETESINDRNNRIVISEIDYDYWIRNLKLEKKTKPHWGSTNRFYWYFKIGNQIITAEEKNYKMMDLYLKILELKK